MDILMEGELVNRLSNLQRFFCNIFMIGVLIIAGIFASKTLPVYIKHTVIWGVMQNIATEFAFMDPPVKEIKSRFLNNLIKRGIYDLKYENIQIHRIGDVKNKVYVTYTVKKPLFAYTYIITIFHKSINILIS